MLPVQQIIQLNAQDRFLDERWELNLLLSTRSMLSGPQVIRIFMMLRTKEPPRRVWAAAVSIIPTTTGAAKSLGDVPPHLHKKRWSRVRVTNTGWSLTDVTCIFEGNILDLEEINAAFFVRVGK